jgi:hypothetical protein
VSVLAGADIALWDLKGKDVYSLCPVKKNGGDGPDIYNYLLQPWSTLAQG